MDHKIIDGKRLAQGVKDDVKARVTNLKELGWQPRLISIDVGDSAAVSLYIKNQQRAAVQVAGWITSVPRGVGPMTVAMLVRNTVVATERQKQRYEGTMRAT
jgi:5,10-methylene-tetrahydrofolate dehydrogenase/methenyl tetrahydrofolate cyclohydrolase